MAARGRRRLRERIAARAAPANPAVQLCRAVAEWGLAAQLLATWCVVLLLVLTGGELLASLEGPGELAAVTEFEARMAQLQEGLGDTEKAQLQKVLDFRISNSLCSVPSLDALSWSRGGAYYYVLTALTTIGYGTFVPATANGKVGSMLFCVVALVLFGIANTMLGGAIEQLLASGVRRCRRARRQRRQRSSGGARVVVVAAAKPERLRHEQQKRRELRGAGGEGEVAARDGGDDDDDAHEKAANAQVSSALGVVVLMTWLLLMAAFFAHSEGWSFADGLYFAFITATTIGLGDFAPTVARDTFLSYSFILGGVTLMSVCMHSVGRLLSSLRAKAELLARHAASAAATAASHRHLGSHRNLLRDRGVTPVDEGDDGGSGGGGGDADAASPTGAAAGGELGARAALGQIAKALCVFALLVLAGGGMLHHIEYDEHAAAMDGYAAAVSGVCSKTASNETISSKKQFETTGGAGNCTALVFAFHLLDDKTAFCGRSAERACYTTCSRQAGSKPGQFCRAACLRDCRLFGDQLLQCSSLREFCANPAAYGAQKTGGGRPIPGSNSSANASGTGGAGAWGAGGGGKPGSGKGPLGKPPGKGRRLSKWFKPKGPKGPTNKTLAGARFPQKRAPVNETLDKVQELLATLGCPEPDVSPSANPWELLSAMMFALTIVTTIGYGSFSVQTAAGKAFVCVFAVVGIVVFSWCNMQFVEALMTMVRAEEGSCKRACQRKQRSPRAAPARPSVLLHVAFVMVLAFLFLLIGAAVLQSRDHNGDGVADGLLGAFWFLFVSTTTIGFGDYTIPGSGVGFFLLAALIILVGLALVGMALQSVTDIFEYFYKEKVALRHAAATSMQALFRGKLSERSQRSQDSSAPNASILVIADITDAPSVEGPSIVV